MSDEFEWLQKGLPVENLLPDFPEPTPQTGIPTVLPVAPPPADPPDSGD
jgi:hypothetical protein